MKLKRTALFIPGTAGEDQARKTIKTCGADIICLDLEDTVVPECKGEARQSIVRLLKEDIWGNATRAVRINAVSSGYAEDDIVEVVGGAGDRVESLLLSKPESVDEILWLDDLIEKLRKQHGFTGKIGYVVAVESAFVLTNIDDFASCSPNVEGLGFAIGDLSTSLGIAVQEYMNNPEVYPGDLYHFHRSRIVLAARTHGLWAMDSPWPLVHDLEMLATDAHRGAIMGFNGKLVLVPEQVKTVHKAYRPSDNELTRAQNLLIDIKAMQDQGLASGVAGGSFIDPVVIAHAKATLLRGEAPL